MKVDVNYIIRDKYKSNTGLELNPKYIRGLTIVENIETMFLSGSLVFEDKGGFVENILTGNEIIEINIKQNIQETTNDNTRAPIDNFQFEKDLIFEIYNISMTVTTSMVSEYTFYLIEQGGFDLLSSHICKSYKQKAIGGSSGIIKDIFDNQLHFKKYNIDYEIEDTKGQIDFLIPNWKPTTTLKYLNRIAKNLNDESGFIFYTSLISKFNGKKATKSIKHFKCLSSLLNKKIKRVEDTRQAEDLKYYFRAATIPSTYINNILDIGNPNYLNRDGIRSGIQGKTYYGIDFHTDKKILKETKSILDYTKNSIFLGAYSHYSKDMEDLNSEIKFIGYHDNTLLQNEINHNFRMEFERITSRDIYCTGSLSRYVGQIIDIQESSGSSLKPANTALSGTWLIKRIIHNIIATDYRHKITIVKNALSDIPDSAKNIAISINNKNV